MKANKMFPTLMLAREFETSEANEKFLYDLSYRFGSRGPREDPWTEIDRTKPIALTDRFPGLRAATIRENLTWCREAREEELQMATEDGWTPADGGSTAEYLATMDASIRQQEQELAAL